MYVGIYIYVCVYMCLYVSLCAYMCLYVSICPMCLYVLVNVFMYACR